MLTLDSMDLGSFVNFYDFCSFHRYFQFLSDITMKYDNESNQVILVIFVILICPLSITPLVMFLIGLLNCL